MKKQFFIFIVSILLLGCKSDDSNDCGATGYPPPRLSFTFVDETTGENLFANAIWHPDEIAITDAASSDVLNFHMAMVSGSPLLILQIPYEEGHHAYIFKRNNEMLFTMNFDVVSQNLKCYTKTSAADIQLTNVGFELLGDNAIKVLVR